MTNSSKECQPWADHPTGTYWAAGAFVDSQVILCGGTTPDENYSNVCHLITPTSTEAIVSLNVGSYQHAATEFHGKVLMSGGFGKNLNRNLNRNQVHIGIFSFDLFSCFKSSAIFSNTSGFIVS